MILLIGLAALLVAIGFALEICYILLLTVAALFYHEPKTISSRPKSARFVILVPAHNESLTLPTLLGPLKALKASPASPPPVLIVIADNCTDNTAEIARAAGIIVYERHDLSAKGKGYALEWAIQKLEADFPDYNAIAIIDADTLPDTNFLNEAENALNRGAQVIQGRYDVLNPFENQRTTMQYVAFALSNHLRPLGRMTLQLSDWLRGNGMVISREVLEKLPWQAYGLVEDMEYTSKLVQNNYKVTYAPKAIVYGQAPATAEQATSQRLRWEGGRGQQARRDVPPLLKQALAKRNFILLDRAMDLLIPPFTLLIMLTSLVASFNVLAALLLKTKILKRAAAISLASLAGLVAYVVGGLLIARVPARTFLLLLDAPFYLLWKARVYLRLLSKRAPTEWVRTARNPIKE